MFKNNNFTGSKWEIAKIIMAAVCILLIIDQISAGIKMIQSNENLPQLVSESDFDSLTVGTEIRGELTHIDGEMDGTAESDAGDILYYIVITDAKKIIPVRTVSGSKTDKQIRNLQSGGCDSVEFRGYVRALSDADKTSLNLMLISTNFLHKNGIEGGTQKAMLRQLIDITEGTATIPQKYITFTFVTAGLLALLIPLLLRKTIRNARTSWKIRTGKISEKRLLQRDDYIFEDEGLYRPDGDQGESFFVNTEHNIRNEGAIGKVSEDLLTHMVSQGDMFYEGGLNEEGNFYVDSSQKNQTLYSDNPDDDNFLKKY